MTASQFALMTPAAMRRFEANALLALQAVRRAQHTIEGDRGSDGMGCSDAADHRAAIGCCLVSVSALLTMSLTLSRRQGAATGLEREQEQRELSAITKQAGRSIYQAGLLAVAPGYVLDAV